VSGIAKHHRNHDEISGEQRVATLQELVNWAAQYEATPEDLGNFLERIELDRTIENQEDGAERVTLITVHNTKGLEFRKVIITGLEQGLFPRYGKDDHDLEEERRLFYVGATRAMDELYLTCCQRRRVFGETKSMKPSLFLQEADKSLLHIVGTPPYGFQAGAGGAALGGVAGGGVAGGGGGMGAGAAARTESSDGRWRLGDRVFNEDKGHGEVAAIEETDDGPVVTVRYEHGNTQRFLSLVQSSRFMKIKD
jgi:DNA helicase-2/ATP-dependent DNA helicase PcrA